MFSVLPEKLTGTWVLRTALLLVFFLVTFPSLLPEVPGVCLDDSWRIGLNQAAARGMVFGREVVFTYGPLGFVCSPHDVGNNLTIAICFRLVIYTLALSALVIHARSCANLCAYCAFLLVAALSGSWAVMYFWVPVAVIGWLALACLRESLGAAFLAAFVTATSLLMKFNVGVAALGCLTVWAGVCVISRPSSVTVLRLCLTAAVLILTLIALFGMFGGPISALPTYFKSALQVSSGYSAQMSMRGPEWKQTLAFIEMTLLGITAVTAGRKDRRYVALGLILVPMVFVLFKSGFVRHQGHSFFCAIPVLACYLLPCAERKIEVSGALLAVTALCVITLVVNRPASWASVLPGGYENLGSLAHWSQERAVRARAVQEIARSVRLPQRIVIKVGAAPVDAYPWDIAVATSNALNWRPRPIFQSYSAYTPELDQLNAEAYRGSRAPSFILYRHQALGCHPIMVDPATWLEMFRWYDVDEQYEESTLLLKRRTLPRFGEVVRLGQTTISPGERWEIPSHPGSHILLKAQVALQAAGQLRNFLFKVYAPKVTVEYVNQTTETFELVWRNAEEGFLASDLPLTIDEVREFWEKGVGNPVKAITFHPDTSFQPRIDLTWASIPVQSVE